MMKMFRPFTANQQSNKNAKLVNSISLNEAQVFDASQITIGPVRRTRGLGVMHARERDPKS